VTPTDATPADNTSTATTVVTQGGGGGGGTVTPPSGGGGGITGGGGLPFTGPGLPFAVAVTAGMGSVLLGGVLLAATRRRTAV
jgi:hypothetical protein